LLVKEEQTVHVEAYSGYLVQVWHQCLSDFKKDYLISVISNIPSVVTTLKLRGIDSEYLNFAAFT